MLSLEDNQLLTRTGPQTPMGEFFRRFWVPVLLSEELPEPDCPPKKLTILGEDLLAFRDTQGRVGLIDPACPHRGANLYFGRNEAGGIRCVFHGLKFDIHGECVDIPVAPPETDKSRLRIKSYPAREAGGMIWAYMGPDEEPPPLPALEFTLVPDEQYYVSKKWQACNWAQCVEGALDTAHFSFLHMVIAEDEAKALSMLKHAAIGAQAVQNDRVRWVRDDPMPTFEIAPTDVGLTIGGARRADGDELYWRIAQFMLPNHALAPSAFPGELMHGQTWVPVGDDACWIFTYTWHPDRPLTKSEREMCESGHTVHAKVDEFYRPLAGPHNDYLMDREEQKHRSFTGIQGVSEQDAAIQDSQGPIADRTREHLFATDLGVVRFRRLILSQVRELQEGKAPAASRLAARYALRSGGWVAPRGQPLADVMQERFGDPQGCVSRQYGLD